MLMMLQESTPARLAGGILGRLMLDRIRLLRDHEFQSFCSVLLSLEDPAFQAVNGSGGDFGNDGFLVTKSALCQAYGPAKETLSKVRAKIDESVAQAVRLRANEFPRLQRLVLLTPFDLTHDMHMHLQSAGASALLAAESWGETKLASLLGKHPSVRAQFPEFLLADITGELRNLRGAIEDRVKPDSVEDFLGPDFHPDLYVLQKNELPGPAEHRAYAFFRVRVFSESLRHLVFEPNDERQFLALVHAEFPEDRAAELEPPLHDGVQVEYRDPDLRYHRRWGHWTFGAVGMAATLRDLYRPDAYSAADVAVDLTRLLRLAARIGRQGSARIVLEINSDDLRVEWDPSDRRARARLRGIDSVAWPKLERRDRKPEKPVEHAIDLRALAAVSPRLAGEMLWPAMKACHGARIDRAEFSASVSDVLADCELARNR
jgi:hypothetical protein